MMGGAGITFMITGYRLWLRFWMAMVMDMIMLRGFFSLVLYIYSDDDYCILVLVEVTFRQK